MADNPPLITGVHFEQTPERLKIVLPVKRNIPLIILYSVLVLLWLGMMIGAVVFGVQMAFSGERYAFSFTVMILVFIYVLYRFGKVLWRQWGSLVANRQIMFINSEELVLRRPVSIWGNTDAYDMEHVQPFYIDEESGSPMFDYGYRHVAFAEPLSAIGAGELVRFLNGRYFPDAAYESDAALESPF